MIRLSKTFSAPAKLQSAKVKRAKAAIQKKVASGQSLSSKTDFPDYWRSDIEIRKAIWIRSNRKCCYCERRRDLKREADIDHFRPKAEIAGGGKSGYWWLAYNWNNLFFSCKACNQTKTSEFPLVSGNRVRIPTGNINLEKPFLPHPIDEDPEKLIGYRLDEMSPVEQVKPYGKDKNGRGEKTIHILGLDRLELTSEQSRSLLILDTIVAKYYAGKHLGNTILCKNAMNEIRELTVPQNEFAGLKRAFFKARGLGKFVSQDR